MGKGKLITVRFNIKKPGRSHEDFLKLVEDSGKTQSKFVKDKIFGNNSSGHDSNNLIIAMCEQFLIQNIEFTEQFPDSLWEILESKYINIAVKRILERKKNGKII